MEKQALLEACKAAGGQMALARLLGMSSQGSVSNWIIRGRAPAERVLQIEAVTGVSRHKLRPDLYPDATGVTAQPANGGSEKRAAGNSSH